MSFPSPRSRQPRRDCRRTMRLAGSLAVSLALLVTVHRAHAQQARAESPVSEPEQAVLPVQGSVYLLAGFGANVTVQVGGQGVLVVDSGDTAVAHGLLSSIRKIAPGRPIRVIVNTSADRDDIGGNEILRTAGSAIFGGNVVFDDPRGPQGAIVLAHENVGLRLAMAHQGHSEAAQPLWPTDAFAGDSYDLFFNDEPVRLLHVAGAHTDGDVLVFFRRSDVLATGDVFSTVSYPVIDVRHGGTIDGEISALNRIIEIAIPRDKEEGGTIIVPGHGRLCDEADVVEYRDMVTIIRDRIRDMMSRGLSLERIQSLKPTYDYDARYGSTAGPWTTRDFVESIYRTLKPSLRGTQP